MTIEPGAARARRLRGIPACAMLTAVLGLGLLAGAATSARAAEGDSQALIFVGTTRFASDDATSYGTTFGGSFGYEIIDNLLWSVGASASTTDGTATVDNKTYDIYARTMTIQTGPNYYFNRSPGSLLIPYIGAGVSVLNYDVEYEFPGSKLGKTSGTGPGAYALAGVELWLSRSVTLVTQYTLASHQVKTEEGEYVALRSGGLGLSIRIGIRI